MNGRVSARARFFAVLLTLSASGAPAFARHSEAYLRAIGPAPLRFEVAMARSFAFPKSETPALSEKTPSEIPMPTNSVPTNSTPMAIDYGQPAVTPISEPANPIGEPAAPMESAASVPAEDAAMVTPQMLTEYLIPTPGYTNGPSASVVMPLNFTPPSTKNPGESRATYKVQ